MAMGQLFVVLLSIILSNTATAKPVQFRTRNVTVEELLVYGFVPDIPPATATRSVPIGSRRDAPHGPAARPRSRSETNDEPANDSAFNIGARVPLTDADFVSVMGTCAKRHHLARASMGWRSPATATDKGGDDDVSGSGDDGTGFDGVRAYFLSDVPEDSVLEHLNAKGAAAGEVYAYFPNDGDKRLGGWHRGAKLGDTRAAVAPFAAHRHFGESSYKWMLFGDDDTLFHMGALKTMLADLDPELPYAISDNLWADTRHPNPHAPRCLPCHMDGETLPSLKEILHGTYGKADARMQFVIKKKPFSDQQVDHFAANTTEVPGKRYVPQPACPYCTAEAVCGRFAGTGVPCDYSTAHGGAGVILSVGLLRHISYDSYLACILGIDNSPGGDDMFAYCLWQHGIAFTDPGPYVRHMYDPFYIVLGAGAGHKLLFDAKAAVASGACDARCAWQLKHTATLHMSARKVKDWDDLAQQMEVLPRVWQEARESLQAQADGTDVAESDDIVAPERRDSGSSGSDGGGDGSGGGDDGSDGKGGGDDGANGSDGNGDDDDDDGSGGDGGGGDSSGEDGGGGDSSGGGDGGGVGGDGDGDGSDVSGDGGVRGGDGGDDGGDNGGGDGGDKDGAGDSDGGADFILAKRARGMGIRGPIRNRAASFFQGE